MVLIHGWPLSADMWEHQHLHLAEQGFRVVAYDRRGFGRSDQPWSGYDYDTFADDLASVIDSLGLDRAALVGFSMGGGEGARYLGRQGAAKVSKAVLISAVPPFLPTTTPKAPIRAFSTDRRHPRGPGEVFADFGKTFYGRLAKGDNGREDDGQS